MTDDGKDRERAGRGKAWRYGLGAVAVVVALGVIGYDQFAEHRRDPALLDRALRVAIAQCEAADVRALIARGADPNRIAPEVPPGQMGQQPVSGSTPLQVYARCNTPDTLQALSDGGAELRPHLARITELSLTPAHPEVLAWLLDHGLNPDLRRRNVEGWDTLVHRVARRAQPEMLELLLAHGADPNLRASDGQTPLGQVRAQINRINEAAESAMNERWMGPGAQNPEEYYAAVIALLQEAGGTE